MLLNRAVAQPRQTQPNATVFLVFLCKRFWHFPSYFSVLLLSLLRFFTSKFSLCFIFHWSITILLWASCPPFSSVYCNSNRPKVAYLTRTRLFQNFLLLSFGNEGFDLVIGRHGFISYKFFVFLLDLTIFVYPLFILINWGFGLRLSFHLFFNLCKSCIYIDIIYHSLIFVCFWILEFLGYLRWHIIIRWVRKVWVRTWGMQVGAPARVWTAASRTQRMTKLLPTY